MQVDALSFFFINVYFFFTISFHLILVYLLLKFIVYGHLINWRIQQTHLTTDIMSFQQGSEIYLRIYRYSG